MWFFYVATPGNGANSTDLSHSFDLPSSSAQLRLAMPLWLLHGDRCFSVNSGGFPYLLLSPLMCAGVENHSSHHKGRGVAQWLSWFLPVRGVPIPLVPFVSVLVTDLWRIDLSLTPSFTRMELGHGASNCGCGPAVCPIVNFIMRHLFIWYQMGHCWTSAIFPLCHSLCACLV